MDEGCFNDRSVYPLGIVKGKRLFSIVFIVWENLSEMDDLVVRFLIVDY